MSVAVDTKLGAPIPKTVGAAIDLLDATRDERRRLDALSSAVKDRENEIETKIFEQFSKQDLDGGRGKIAQASIESADVPTLDDYEAFADHIKKHPEDLDLLQRRLSTEAVRGRWANKIAVPGVGTFTKIKLHLTKVKLSGAKPRAPQ